MKSNGYKETDIGTIPNEWEVVRLRHVAKVQGGFAFRSAEYSKHGIPIVRINNVKDGFIDLSEPVYWTADDLISLSQFLLREGDIALTMTGLIGNVGMIAADQVPAFLNQRVARLDILDSTKIDRHFLYFAARTSDFRNQLNGNAFGAIQQNISGSKIEQTQFPLPPLTEQCIIATILSKIQQAIETQEKIIARTKELKKSLMAKLFTEGLNGEELKETEIGLMPKSWEVVSVGDVATFQGGYAFKSEDYSEAGVRLFKISNVSFGKCVWDDVSFLPEEYLSKHADFSLVVGDLVMAMTRPIVSGGIKVARLSESDYPALLNQRVGRFQKKGNLDIEFLFQSVFDRRFFTAISDGAGGSQQPNISSKQIERIRIPLPPIDEQREIGRILSLMDSKIKTAENQTKTIRHLFKSMLHQLMTGTIRVNNMNL